jgi:hypothetical protein
MMWNKFPKSLEFLDGIYWDGERMAVKENKEEVDQPIMIWSAFCMKK